MAEGQHKAEVVLEVKSNASEVAEQSAKGFSAIADGAKRATKSIASVVKSTKKIDGKKVGGASKAMATLARNASRATASLLTTDARIKSFSADPISRVSRSVDGLRTNVVAANARVVQLLSNLSKDPGGALANAGERLGGAFKGAGEKIQGIGKGMEALGSKVFFIKQIVQVVGQAIQKFDEWSQAQIRNQAISRNLQVNIAGAGAAFQGLVSDVELARQANSAMTLGVVNSGREFTELALAASVLGQRIGEDATSSIESAVIALGRGSTAMLDNLGVVLKQAEAQEMYAEFLEKDVKALTDVERAEAFRWAGLKKLTEASQEAVRTNQSAALTFQQLKTQLGNVGQEFTGFDSRVGKAREALRNLDGAALQSLKTIDVYGASVQEVDEAFAKWAEAEAKATSELTGTTIAASEFRTSIEEIQAILGDEGINLVAEEETRRSAEQAQAAAEAALAPQRERAALLTAEADDLSWQTKLMAAMGTKQQEINGWVITELELRKEAAEVVGDTVKTMEIARKLELAEAKAIGDEQKARSRGRGPSRADIIRAEGQARVDALTQEIKLIEVRGQALGTAAEDAQRLAEARDAAAIAALDLEQRALEATRARGRVARARQEVALQEIAAQRQILELQTEINKKAAERSLIEQATAETRAQAVGGIEREARAVARVIDLQQVRQERAIAQIELEGAAAEAAATRPLELLEARGQTQARLHAQRMAQLKTEQRAAEAVSRAAEETLRAQAPQNEAERIKQQDDLAQLAHERELGRQRAEIAFLKETEAERQRIAEQARARFQAQLQDVNTWVGALGQAQTTITGAVQQGIGFRQTAQDAAFERWRHNLESGTQAQVVALDQRIKNAEGNAALQADLERKKFALERSTEQKIAEAEAKSQEKRKRQEMQFQGAMLLIQAAVSTGKAVGSYPDIPAMVIHSVAAATQSALGFALLSGVIPAGGGAGIAGGGAGGSAGGSLSRSTSEGPSTPESVPGAQVEREGSQDVRRAGGPGAGGVNIQIGEVNALGSVDEESAEKIGIAITDSLNGREFAA